MQKTPREKPGVIDGEGGVVIGLPAYFKARLLADEPRCALVAPPLEVAGNSIDGVSRALPPIENPVCGQRDVLPQRQLDVWVQVAMVERADRRQLAKVCAFGK